MRILKFILSIIAILIGLYLLACLVMSKDYDVSRTITVNAPIELVFNQANDFNEMKNWSPWKDYDPNAEITITGELGMPGYKYAWKSKNENVGIGYMSRTKTEQNKLIENDLYFEGFENTSVSYWTFENTPEGVKVVWGNKGDMPFLMKPLGPMMDKWMGPDFEKGLQRIKDYVETNKDKLSAGSIKVEEVQLPEMFVMTMRDTASNATISMKLGKCYGEIGAVMQKQKLNMAGAPFAIYHDYHENYFDMEPGVATDKEGKSEGKITARKMNATKAVVAHYYGRYEDTGKGHEAADAYIKAKGLTVSGKPWESYITDPMTEKDTSKWLTDVYYPVK